VSRRLCPAFLACLAAALVSILPVRAVAAGPFADWRHSGSLYILTTPAGADLPAGASVEQFPLLVRLHGDTFDFSQAKEDGADLRFSTADGTPLAHEIESWDATRGAAAVWVRVPRIEGNAVQELRLHWGNLAAPRESNGKAVFDAANGYLSVWHMGEEVADATGTLASHDTGTTPVAGAIALARHFPGGKGVFCGKEIASYPTGAEPHTTQAWFRPEKPNGLVLAWGNEEAQGKVTMNFRSPPQVSMDCYFSGGNVEGKTDLAMGRWVHVVHTYREGETRLYVDGVLDTENVNARPPMKINRPARLFLGGWYDNYSFVGDLDEVRVSKVVRSAEWVKLEYENQKPAQSLVGPVVPRGDAFEVTPARLAVAEGKSGTVTATAGGARKLSWVLTRGGRETVVAVDRLSYTFDAGRVAGDEAATLELRAVFADGVKSRTVPIAVQEAIPEPALRLAAPATWDGRAAVTVVPTVTNRDALEAAGAGDVRFTWKLSGPAIHDSQTDGKLVLRRSLMSGPLTATLVADNGGAAVEASATIAVTQPKRDPWLPRTPGPDEHPLDGQFYARDEEGCGTLVCSGRLEAPAGEVVLEVFKGNEPFARESCTPDANGEYAVMVRIPAGLVTYRAVCRAGDRVLHEAKDLVCGDVFLINGQSNAVATDFGKDDPPAPNAWVRTFGTTEGGPGSRQKFWATGVARAPGGKGEIGYWGVELGRRLVESQKVPICIINGAVGGTRIDQHQRNCADYTDVNTIYGRLLWRVREAGLEHGVRGILWHQGESDQGSDGPTGGYGWETYRSYFHALAASWQEDYPNLRHIHMFQIWPHSCSMGRNGSDDRLREVQRILCRDFSRLGVMSTLGIRPPGGCHYPAAGYAEFARLIAPLVERDHYGRTFEESITPPNLVKATFASPAREAIALEFDQPVVWKPELASEFLIDGRRGRVAEGSVAGNLLTLKLGEPGPAGRITYLESRTWSQDRLLMGTNGIAALTFCEVPVTE
jgi:hypothetical protein